VVFQVAVQEIVPEAVCQVAPLLADHDTETTPDVTSAALPVTLTAPFTHCSLPGLAMDEVGGTVSICTVKVWALSWFPATSVEQNSTW